MIHSIGAQMSAPQPTQQHQQGEKKSGWHIFLAIWAVVGPLVGAGIGAYMGHRSASVSEATLARASGKIRAKLSVRFVPEQSKVPAPYHKKNKFLQDAIAFKDLNSLQWLNPCVIIKNTGDEPIDAIRVKTRFVGGFIDVIDAPPDVQRGKTPYVVRQAEDEEYILSEKLMPGKEARVSIVKGLVGQMVQAQATDQRITRDHYGSFQITCYGRIVGGPGFDGAEAPIGIMFIWVPKGFPEGECKKVLTEMRPSVEILGNEE
jgi:hypothetical protein